MNRQVAPYAESAGVNARAAAGEAYFRGGDDLGYVTATTVIAGQPRGPGAVQGGSASQGICGEERRRRAFRDVRVAHHDFQFPDGPELGGAQPAGGAGF
jgi:hypothetical protein